MVQPFRKVSAMLGIWPLDLRTPATAPPTALPPPPAGDCEELSLTASPGSFGLRLLYLSSLACIRARLRLLWYQYGCVKGTWGEDLLYACPAGYACLPELLSSEHPCHASTPQGLKMTIVEADISELGGLARTTSSTGSAERDAAVSTDLNSIVNIDPAVVPRSPTEEGPPGEEAFLPSSAIMPSPREVAVSFDEADVPEEHSRDSASGPVLPALVFNLADEPAAPTDPSTPSAENANPFLEELALHLTSKSGEPDGASSASKEHPIQAFPVQRPPSDDHATVSRPKSVTLPSSPASSEATSLPSAQATPGIVPSPPTPHPDDLIPPDTRDLDTVERPMDVESVPPLPQASSGRVAALAEEPNPSTISNASNGIVSAKGIVAPPPPAPPTSDSISNHHVTSTTSQSFYDSRPNRLGSLSHEAVADSSRSDRTPPKHDVGSHVNNQPAAVDTAATRTVAATKGKMSTPASSKVPSSVHLVSSNAELEAGLPSSSEPPPPPYQARHRSKHQNNRAASSDRGSSGGRARRGTPSPQHLDAAVPHGPEWASRSDGTGQHTLAGGLHHVVYKPPQAVLYPPRSSSFADSSQARPTTSSPDADVPAPLNGTAQGGKRISSQFWLKFVLTCGCIRGEGHYITEEHRE
ncbi:hypothetical protein FKP32DRAFT_1326828 [Trametes sanguinea]|nr:hypothetical protein FKP32DRAFT_1326828 [Trametes sanguinea]